MNKKQVKQIIIMYQKQQCSTYEIAEKFNTYPNKIRRILKQHGIELRNAKTAQKNALKKGRAIHPTKGVGLSDKAKTKISESQGEVWDSLNVKEKKHRSKINIFMCFIDVLFRYLIDVSSDYLWLFLFSSFKKEVLN